MKFHDIDGEIRPLLELSDEYFSPRWLGRKLGGIRRFQGDPRALTVLEHSILCAQEALAVGLDIHVAGWCLTHDLAEAFLGDWHGPSKNAAQHAVELEVDAALILKGWRIPPTGSRLVKMVDDHVYRCERRMMWPKVYGSTSLKVERRWLDLVQELEVYHGNAG